MKKTFTGPVIEVRELSPEQNVMDKPMLISGEDAVESRFVADNINSSYTAWKGKTH